MIEVQINPDDYAGNNVPPNQWVKSQLQKAGVPVVVDAKHGFQFTQPGRIHADFSHKSAVYQWVPAVDAPLPEPLFGVGLQFDDISARAHG